MKPGAPELVFKQARDIASQGELSSAWGALRAMDPTLLDPDAACAFWLTESYLRRREQNWIAARESALKASRLARVLDRADLQSEAVFAQAFCEVELGRLFSALAKYQSIVESPRTPPYRAALAKANLAWVMWDLGRADQLEAALPDLNAVSSARARIALHMMRADRPALEKTLRSHEALSWPLENRFNAALLMAEASSVLGLTGFKKSWAFEALRVSMESESLETAVLARLALALLGLENSAPPSATAMRGSWRFEVDRLFLESLRLSGSGESARNFYTHRLNPFLRKLRLASPLVPILDTRGFQGDSAWAQALNARLGLSPARAEAPLLHLRGTKLIQESTGRFFDFSKRPVSLKLVRLLEGPPGRELSKKWLHEELTPSKYSPALNDARLRKLFSRLTHELSQSGLPPLVQLARNESVLTLAHILVDRL